LVNFIRLMVVCFVGVVLFIAGGAVGRVSPPPQNDSGMSLSPSEDGKTVGVHGTLTAANGDGDDADSAFSHVTSVVVFGITDGYELRKRYLNGGSPAMLVHDGSLLLVAATYNADGNDTGANLRRVVNQGGTWKLETVMSPPDSAWDVKMVPAGMQLLVELSPTY